MPKLAPAAFCGMAGYKTPRFKKEAKFEYRTMKSLPPESSKGSCENRSLGEPKCPKLAMKCTRNP